jgi:TRAP-type C4-dicarboxylate transport system permease small subunit
VKALAAVGIAALLVMVVATLLALVTRFLGVTGFEWSYEVAGISFVWTSFLGVALAEARQENAAFAVLHDAAPPRLRRALDRVGVALLAVVGAVLAASGVAALSRSAFVPTPLLRWPSGIQIAAAPVLGAVLLAIALGRLFRRDGRG